jgi:hypothetical protein
MAKEVQKGISITLDRDLGFGNFPKLWQKMSA